jgi:hypothetical protein
MNGLIGEKSNLVKFDPFWTDLIQNKTAIFILMVDVTTFYSIKQTLRVELREKVAKQT